MNVTMPWNDRKQTNRWSAQLDDVKKQLAKQSDYLAQVAADMGRDAAAQASNVTADAGSAVSGAARDLGSQAAGTARDLGSTAAKTTADVGAQAASVAREVPVGAAALAAQALKGLQRFGGEIRKVRITTEPPKAQRSPDIRPGVALLAGVGSGLALMYFYDPNEGRRRRALLRDQLTKWTRITRRSAEGTAKDLRNRSVGVMHEAKKAVNSRTGMGDDMTEIASNGYAANETVATEQSPFTESQPQHSQVG